MNFVEQLINYFNNTPRKTIEEEWRKYDKYNKIGPTVNEYMDFVNSIKKPQWPKNFEECCKVLGLSDSDILDTSRENGTRPYGPELWAYYKLLIARDAFRKVASEEMGLDKPWEPDWGNSEQVKYVLLFKRGAIYSDIMTVSQCLLAFPTEESRDQFLNIFWDLIESSKDFI